MNEKIVRLAKEHLPAVAELERQCFAEPWSVHALELFLGEDAVAFAALSEKGEPVGYGGMLLVPDEGQVLNLAVHPKARRQGIGSRILAALLEEAKKCGSKSVSLEVRVSNRTAIGLYEHFGFRSVGIRRHFYRHPAEDALVMVCDLSALPSDMFEIFQE